MPYNYIKNNNIEVFLKGRCVYINGCSYPLPKKCKGQSISTINGRIFIDGYEFKQSIFKRTLKAFYYKYF